MPEPDHIVLAGGGYAHLLALRDHGLHELPRTRLTLVSPDPLIPYTGLLPARIAGDCGDEAMHIDLADLCRRRGVTFIQDRMTHIEAGSRHIQLASGSTLPYSLLSLNTGPVADLSIAGVREHAINVKPAVHFLPAWKKVLQETLAAPRARKFVMVGGGAGSVELIIAMAETLQREQSRVAHSFTLLCGASRLLPGFPRGAAGAALKRCRELGIDVRTKSRISLVESTLLFSESSFSNFFPYDILFWCTAAAAPDWLRLSGLACDRAGFVRVDACLQSLSHPGIFAAGDVAGFDPRPLPKSGVMAVHEAPVLAENIKRTIQKKPLLRHKPRVQALYLLRLGPEHAAGAFGPIGFNGKWVKRWKQRIDNNFIESFTSM